MTRQAPAFGAAGEKDAGGRRELAMAKKSAGLKRPKVSVYQAVNILKDAVPAWVGLASAVEMSVERLAMAGLTVEHARSIGEYLESALRGYKESAMPEGDD